MRSPSGSPDRNKSFKKMNSSIGIISETGKSKQFMDIILTVFLDSEALDTNGLESKLVVHCGTKSGSHNYKIGETETIKILSGIDVLDFKRAIRVDGGLPLDQTLNIYWMRSYKAATTIIGSTIIPLSVFSESSAKDNSQKENLIAAENSTNKLRPGNMSFDLTNDEKVFGKVHLDHKIIEDNQSQFVFKLDCYEVKNVGLFKISKNDCYLVLSRPTDRFINHELPSEIPESEWLRVYKTETVKSSLEPCFAQFKVGSWILTKGNSNIQLKVEIWDENRFTKDDLISVGYTSLGAIQEGLSLPTKTEKNKNAGMILFRVFKEHRLFDREALEDSGVVIRSLLTVDCSLSNQNMHCLYGLEDQQLAEEEKRKNIQIEKEEISSQENSSESLKETSKETTQETKESEVSGEIEMNSKEEENIKMEAVIDKPPSKEPVSNSEESNPSPKPPPAVLKPKPCPPVEMIRYMYQQAITEISTILLKRQKDHRIGFTGFGAKVNEMKDAVFSFNSKPRNCSIGSTEEALEEYAKTVLSWTPEEPTYFDQVLGTSLLNMQHLDDPSAHIYTLQVVLTDGLFADEQQIVDTLVELGQKPYHLVLVGIGEGDFSFLEALEAGFSYSYSSSKSNEDAKKKKKVRRLVSSSGKELKALSVKFILYRNYVQSPAELEERIFRDFTKRINDYYHAVADGPLNKQ